MKILAGIIGAIVMLIFSAYAYMGGFYKVKVEQTQSPQMDIIFTTHLGPYENLSQSWDAFYADLITADLTDCSGLGVYLDSPDTPPEEIRSIIGCDISSLDEGVKLSLQSKFSSFTLPSGTMVTGTFPFKNEMSYFLAPMKVYPAFQRELNVEELTLPVAIELYGKQGESDQIIFMAPLNLGTEDYQPLFDAFSG